MWKETKLAYYSVSDGFIQKKKIVDFIVTETRLLFIPWNFLQLGKQIQAYVEPHM